MQHEEIVDSIGSFDFFCFLLIMGKQTRTRRPRADQAPNSFTMDPRGALNLKESTVPLLEQVRNSFCLRSFLKLACSQLDDPSGKVRQKACNLLSLASCDAASSAVCYSFVSRLVYKQLWLDNHAKQWCTEDLT